MSFTYTYETFSADADGFDEQFAEFLNSKGSKNWQVKHCNYCH